MKRIADKRFPQNISMQSYKSLLFAGLVLVLCGLLASAGRVSILDEAVDSLDLEALVQVVCEKFTGTSKQIAHISTIPKLADYLRGARDPNHKHYDCSMKYLTSLEDLVEVLNTANDDVCGDQKLRLIEDFHQKYVSKVKKHVENQKRSNKVPKVVKLFFMQYVSEISTRCEQSALKVLAKKEHKISEEEMAKMSKLKGFTDALGISDLSKGCDGIYLLWNMVDNLPLEEDEKFGQFLEKKGGSTRLNVQLNDPRSFALVQTVCGLRVKPMYSQSIYPVLRLADIGYYPRGENQLARDFQDPKSSAHTLLVIAQVCETILPIKVYQDEYLKSDQIVVLTKYEAAQLKPLEVPEKILEEIEKVPVEPVEKVSLIGLDRLPAVNVDEARNIVEMIKSTVESRAHIMMRMFKVIIKNMKDKIKSSLSKYMLSKKNRRNLFDAATLEKVDLDEEVSTRDSMRRRRRDTDESDDESKKPEKTGIWAKTKKFAYTVARISFLFVILVIQLVLWLIKLIVTAGIAVLGIIEASIAGIQNGLIFLVETSLLPKQGNLEELPVHTRKA